MSRSTSGASEAANDINGRLLTPHLDYRPGDSPLNPHEAELRKVSDSLGRISSGRYYPHTLSPQLELQGGHHALGGGFGAHPQPDMSAYMNQNMPRGWGNDYALSAERGAMKAEMNIHGETDYERERAQQIMSNRKLLEDVGLGADGNTVSFHHATLPNSSLTDDSFSDRGTSVVSVMKGLARVQRLSRDVSHPRHLVRDIPPNLCKSFPPLLMISQSVRLHV